MEFILPENIHSIISILNKNGFQAHLAGGCVRDMVIGKTPGDWDITTNATTDEVKALFTKTWDTGLRHGTVTVSYNGTKAEVTTWRKEEGYSDHRRPDRVYFAQSLTIDLSRRDFTINAMAYHPDQGLIDPFGGINDIKLRLIRCVGDPMKRFSEDALRMLRAVRFSSQLGFDIENNTFNAIKVLCDDLSYVSMERIQTEVNKILESSQPHKLSLLWETGLSRTIFPGIESISPDWIELARNFAQHKNRKVILLALLFVTSIRNDAANEARLHLNRLRYDKATIRQVAAHIDCVLSFGPFTHRNLRKITTEYGEETAHDSVMMIDALKSFDKSHKKQNCLNEFYGTIESSSIKLNISGLDLKEAGLCQGSEIKNMLSVLSLIVYEKPWLNDASLLMELASEITRISF